MLGSPLMCRVGHVQMGCEKLGGAKSDGQLMLVQLLLEQQLPPIQKHFLYTAADSTSKQVAAQNSKNSGNGDVCRASCLYLQFIG